MYLLLYIVYSSIAMQYSVISEQEYVLQSRFIPGEVFVEVVIPADYNPEKTYPLLYLLHGYSSDFKQWGDIVDLQEIADEYKFIIVSPDGFSTFFMNSPVHETSQYESFFFEDLVPFIHDRFSVDHSGIFISGLSMGGYGALNLMLARPDYFTAAGSTSGAVEFSYGFWSEISVQYLGNNRLADDLELILGSHSENSDNWSGQSLTSRIVEFKEASKPIFLDTGTEDPLYDINLKLMSNLREQQVPVYFMTQPGGHDSMYWSQSIWQHLDFFQQYLHHVN